MRGQEGRNWSKSGNKRLCCWTLPIDALKVDRNFIRNIQNEKKDVYMVKVIMDIVKYMGVYSIAEGVEEAEQVRILKELGCDIIQGFYFSRPVPPEEFEKFIEERLQVC